MIVDGHHGSIRMHFPKIPFAPIHPFTKPPIVSNLKSPTVDRFDDVQVLIPAYFTQHNISHRKRGRINRGDRAKLPRLDPSFHGAAAGAKGDGLPGPKFLDMVRRPTQTRLRSAITKC